MSNLTRFDDRDSRIAYTPISDWFAGGGGAGEFEGTTVGSRSAGAQMRFSFTGTSPLFPFDPQSDSSTRLSRFIHSRIWDDIRKHYFYGDIEHLYTHLGEDEH
ncbi:hypothetical protein V5O48_013113 [Marasmius crinis-equi]|uniref:Uncharacterized protein n=1 Tax=Marasmius crinis-equi TaxID=585013 RepID=A0ABR3F110_9AGAR